jgi:hypothetical protein
MNGIDAMKTKFVFAGNLENATDLLFLANRNPDEGI